MQAVRTGPGETQSVDSLIPAVAKIRDHRAVEFWVFHAAVWRPDLRIIWKSESQNFFFWNGFWMVLAFVRAEGMSGCEDAFWLA